MRFANTCGKKIYTYIQVKDRINMLTTGLGHERCPQSAKRQLN